MNGLTGEGIDYGLDEMFFQWLVPLEGRGWPEPRFTEGLQKYPQPVGLCVSRCKFVIIVRPTTVTTSLPIATKVEPIDTIVPVRQSDRKLRTRNYRTGEGVDDGGDFGSTVSLKVRPIYRSLFNPA